MSNQDALSTHIGAIEKQLKSLAPISKRRCIYKVHEQLREVNEKAYKPVMLAIGPYNHHGEVGQGFMEEHKLRYLKEMLERTNGHVETYMEALIKLEGKARKCYAECISQSKHEFAKMMLLDGCFIIELFRKYQEYNPTNEGDLYNSSDSTDKDDSTDEDDPIFQLTWVLPRIARDLMLFENQLPFFVLEELFKLSESNEPRDRTESRNSGEHTIDIEEKDGINELALNFFSGFLPFRWNVDTSSYNSTEKIKKLLCLAHEDHSFPDMVLERFYVGFRFMNTEFEHLLGLIHATICISIVDTEIKRQEARVKHKKDEIFQHLFGPICKFVFLMRKATSHASELQKLGSPKIEGNWKEIPYGLELRKVGIEFNMAKKFKDKLDEDDRWINIPFDIELQEAGIALKKAKKFKDLLRERDKNKGRKPKPFEMWPQMDGVELEATEKLKGLLCLNKVKNWKSIPHGEELRDAEVEFNKAKKFKRLLAFRKIDDWNIHSAIELEEAGIKFKAEECDPFSIKFNSTGLMEISPLSIGDHTEAYLRNLIAYEQYSDGDNGFDYVTNYVSFMDDLINSPKDVELLRRRRIIRNYLGDDEVTSTMVNKLGHDITISTTSSIYARTSMDVNIHCSRRRNVWMAKLRHDYFNSPWALLSFLAAVLLLALAITQTVFSIIP
ncbi:hypothetical protein I3843_01G101800 [Carya illinoinensis]|uniref:Uncharacterized protein n=1 Tax=Carya illinoinensis TaxID=32201 RepID=A0A8T1RLM5_CARIL|nr:uncharacterized protein LOC122315232 [Carya illinoinensis]XP_042986990.1 uncharacterized protein LOC122315232 [Carya illinoinensis]XP_042986996.1 uncharacterized protein LOC122315232 [Carya illinoinensis]XP_042987003.1 uncharacterized protein LOC122315232 [Carya illinoinensis]XP_042987010.1 uncharacterized protein LOC122315232 [Carya illinoinensis]XP_042987015.1 uncharacterized protein LOC122315232 [Carya illinoinensis]KAG6667585.1 hypothetical protein CIPAW_01G111000 [Carya illinoinensis]